MPEHLRLLIIWTSQQDYRRTFIVCIWQMGKLRLKLCTRRGQRHEAVETVLGLRSESVWHPCFHPVSGPETSVYMNTPCSAQSTHFWSSPSKVLKWWLWSRSQKYALITHSPGDCPPRGPQTRSLQVDLRWLIPFLCFLPSPTFSSGRRGLQCYLKVLASALLPGTWLPSPGFLLL